MWVCLEHEFDILLPCDRHCRKLTCFTFNENFGMPVFSQNCLDCTTNLLLNLNDANSNWNLWCGNSAHNVSNEGKLSFF